MRLFCEMCAEKMRSNCGGDDYPATVVSFFFLASCGRDALASWLYC